MAHSREPAARPAVVFLVAVWGHAFIRQFLDLGLRTLLAPGNIPALAGECACTFRILTRSGQHDDFSAHPIFEMLRRHCAVEFIAIDDVIFPGNHSTTLTLAYARGMRHSGPAMTQSYFVFLVADYIMADGSLGQLWPLIERGVSGITTGNFQIVKEDAEPALTARVTDQSSPLCIAPRDLLRFAFQYLHPTVTASMPDLHGHTVICNRLFWRVDETALVGRFYLRHMLCIRPETDQFEIGASSDYSFIPEMCPSGNVVAIDDSDRYCVIEMQPRHHEHPFLTRGRLTPRRMAWYLSDWTTRDHRRNADTATIFHTGELPPETAGVVARSAAFVQQVAARLPKRVQPHRGHPYWQAAVGASEEYRQRRQRLGDRAPFTRSEIAGFAGDGSRVLARQSLVRRLYNSWVRNGLSVKPWHPQWPERCVEVRALPATLDGAPAGLVVAGEITPSTDWLARNAPPAWRFITADALEAEPGGAAGSFGQCFVFMRSDELSCLPKMLNTIRGSIVPGGRIVVQLLGEMEGDPWERIKPLVGGLWVADFHVVRSRIRCLLGGVWARILLRASLTVNPRRWALAAVRLAGLSVACFPLNAIRFAFPRLGGRATSVTITLIHG